jgi:hypothetical protein
MEDNKPILINFQSVTPLNNGPIDIEATNKVPKSEDMSATLKTCELDKFRKSNFMQYNNILNYNNMPINSKAEYAILKRIAGMV